MQSYREYNIENEAEQYEKFIPIVTILIIAANVIAAMLYAGTDNYFEVGGINYEYIKVNHEYRRLISYMFLHKDIDHLFGNMLALFLFGKLVEQKLGSLRMAILYFASGIGAGYFSMEMSHIMHPDSVRYSAGASGAVFGIICAAVFLRIVGQHGRDTEKGKGIGMLWSIALVVIYASYSSGANVDIYGHIGGAIVGGILALILNIKKWETFEESTFCKALTIVLTVFLCIVGIGEAHIGRGQASLNDKRVEYIKEQPVIGNESKKYGEVLEKHCVNAKWDSFISEQEKQVVDFTGTTYYHGSVKNVNIQFLVSGDCEAYQLSYFGFDDSPGTWNQVYDYFDSICRE